MLYRTLGKSNIKTSLVSYGTGGPGQFGKTAGLTNNDRQRLIAHAIDLGVNLFDTAAGYGNGDSERWLGQALQGIQRDSYIIATKWSWRPTNNETPDTNALINSIERSMKRLNTDSIDIMQLHGLNPSIYENAVNKYWPALDKLRQEGKIRLIGFSEMMTEDPKHQAPLIALQKHHQLWDTIMLKYGILNQWAEKEVLPLAQKHQVAILNMAPVRYTLTVQHELQALLDQWSQNSTIDVNHPKIRGGFEWLISQNVPSVIAAGYKFAAHHPAISTVITGTSNIKHLEDNIAAMENPTLPDQQLQELKQLLGNSAAYR